MLTRVYIHPTRAAYGRISHLVGCSEQTSLYLAGGKILRANGYSGYSHVEEVAEYLLQDSFP